MYPKIQGKYYFTFRLSRTVPRKTRSVIKNVKLSTLELICPKTCVRKKENLSMYESSEGVIKEKLSIEHIIGQMAEVDILKVVMSKEQEQSNSKLKKAISYVEEIPECSQPTKQRFKMAALNIASDQKYHTPRLDDV